MNLPEAPPEDPGSPATGIPDSSSLPPPTSETSFPPRDTPSAFQSPFAGTPAAPVYPPPPQTFYTAPPSIPQNRTPHIPQRPFQPPHPAPISRTVPTQTSVPQTRFVADEEAIMKAQKHARWAISALNFEDVNTAIKELRGALETLGAS